MKRHLALQPLSRFHRSILFLALVAKKNAPEVKGYPTDLTGKVDYALAFYEQRLLPHFQLEKGSLLDKLQGKDTSLDQLIEAILLERDRLDDLFEQLRNERSEEALHDVGVLLEAHVRKEERQLFEKIQEVCDETFLSRLEL